MSNKNERMEKLNNAGINTGKYFTLDLPEGIKAGSKIHLIIDENGNCIPQTIEEKDVILEQIIEDGYVKNTKLHRRFVMAQMFQGLNYKSYYGEELGYNTWLKRHGFKYTFDTMLEEVRVLGKLEQADKETFNERAHFFTKDVIVQVMEDYMDKLKKHVETLKTYKCKGIPYKKIKGNNIFVEDIEKKIYAPLNYEIKRLQFNTKTYNAIYGVLRTFINDMVKLPYNTPMSKAWVDAYKGEGAFYTLKNLIMYHDCFIQDSDWGWSVKGASAMKVLNEKLDEYQGEGWRMFALMKKVIADNNFDFNKRMEEIYNK